MTWFPENVSKTGYLIDDLFYLAFILVTICFIAVMGFLTYFLIRYRKEKNQKSYYTKGTSGKAVALTITLALLVFILIDVNLAYHDHKAWEVIWAKPDSEDLIHIKVEPEQYVWNARYAGQDGVFDTADDVRVVNDLHMPINTPIIVSLEAKDVIHSFFLPNFRIKQDAIPGITTRLTFEGIKEGVYNIACAQHCGIGHYRMKGTMTVDSKETFKNWIIQNTPKAV